jgi:hypothetical protein
MRLKLVFISSIVAAVVGAGSAIAIILWMFSSLQAITAPGSLVLATFLLPAGGILLASLFVYRHTARRRKLQAALTVLISLALTITFFVIGSIVTPRINPIVPAPDTLRDTP